MTGIGLVERPFERRTLGRMRRLIDRYAMRNPDIQTARCIPIIPCPVDPFGKTQLGTGFGKVALFGGLPATLPRHTFSMNLANREGRTGRKCLKPNFHNDDLAAMLHLRCILELQDDADLRANFGGRSRGEPRKIA